MVKGRVCVTGATGFLGSWMVKRLLEEGYSVNATIRMDPGLVDENSWTDVEFVQSLHVFGSSYTITKTLTEKAAIDLAEKLGLDLVSALPTWITGPFICPNIPDTVNISMALKFNFPTRAGDQGNYKRLKDSSLVHVDDVARAHIHLFEHVEAKGRYIVSAVEFNIEELCELISARYPEYKMPSADSWKDVTPVKLSGLSTKKLEATGFKFENGLEEMFDGAIKSCKEKGFL